MKVPLGNVQLIINHSTDELSIHALLAQPFGSDSIVKLAPPDGTTHCSWPRRNHLIALEDVMGAALLRRCRLCLYYFLLNYVVEVALGLMYQRGGFFAVFDQRMITKVA